MLHASFYQKKKAFTSGSTKSVTGGICFHQAPSPQGETDGWKLWLGDCFPFGFRPIFRCYVSFREGTSNGLRSPELV